MQDSVRIGDIALPMLMQDSVRIGDILIALPLIILRMYGKTFEWTAVDIDS